MNDSEPLFVDENGNPLKDEDVVIKDDTLGGMTWQIASSVQWLDYVALFFIFIIVSSDFMLDIMRFSSDKWVIGRETTNSGVIAQAVILILLYMIFGVVKAFW